MHPFSHETIGGRRLVQSACGFYVDDHFPNVGLAVHSMSRRGAGTETTGFLGERHAKKKARRCCCISIATVACLVLCFVVIVFVSVFAASVVTKLPSEPSERAVALLKRYPLIDGLVLMIAC